MVTNQVYPQYYQGYPNYQYQSPIVQQPSQMTMQNQILTWVQSEEEAIKFPLNAGQSIFIMNQNDDYLYMKAVDQLGKTTFVKKRLIDESDNQEPKVDLSNYIRKDEIENLISNIIQDEVEKIVEKRVSEISFKPTKARKKVPVEDEEE